MTAWENNRTYGDLQANGAFALAVVDQFHQSLVALPSKQSIQCATFAGLVGLCNSEAIFNHLSNTVLRNGIRDDFDFFESFSYFLFSC